MVTCTEQRLRLEEAKTDDHTSESRDVKQNIADVQRTVEDALLNGQGYKALKPLYMYRWHCQL